MRLLLPALFAALACASVANGQETLPETVTAPVSLSEAAAPTEARTASAPDAARPAPRARLTWEQRFAQANASHDGHLTLEQAKAGYATVARHFHDIDADGKGYVTEDDVRAWHRTQRAARHSGQAHDGGSLQPQPAFQRILPQAPVQLHTSTDRTIPQADRAPDPTPSGEVVPGSD